ncbi:MAG: DUF2189 domain-containing protein [Methylobacteriaceae bacterium]|nr:DUF2189 domain-containing protein [Methylobacteriaceae bacterium]
MSMAEDGARGIGETAPRKLVIRTIDQTDVSAALAAGWADFKAAPAYGLFFGGVYTLGGWVIASMLMAAQLNYVIYPLVTGFALVAPFVAAGCYEVSRRLERGLPLGWSAVLGAIFTDNGKELGWMALVSGFVLIIWFDFAVFIYLMFFGLKVPTFGELISLVATTPSGALFLVVGNLTGMAIAAFVFSISVVSAPLLLDRDVDFVTAMITSFKATHANPKPMISWALMIGFLLLIAISTGLILLPLILPLLGHASWHMYRRVIE